MVDYRFVWNILITAMMEIYSKGERSKREKAPPAFRNKVKCLIQEILATTLRLPPWRDNLAR